MQANGTSHSAKSKAKLLQPSVELSHESVNIRFQGRGTYKWQADRLVCCGAAFIRLDTDGRLKLLHHSTVVWSTPSSGENIAYLEVTNSGTVALVTTDGTVAWSVN